MNDTNSLAVRAAHDERALEQLIAGHEGFIRKCASTAAKRFITTGDDEWAVALEAFVQAVRAYRPEQGAFLSFAQLLITRRLTDFFRSNARHSAEISVSPAVFEGGAEEEGESPALRAEVAKQLSVTDEYPLRQEIAAANDAFSSYGFTFFDLADCSPKAEKTKRACAKAVACLLKNTLMLQSLRASKLLPINLIEKSTGVPRKILERHRKYIIAATEILFGDYPGLAEYMRCVREELAQ